jgi:hypothetical protein
MEIIMTNKSDVLDLVEQPMTNAVAGIFNENSDWFFPSPELCKRENLFPNMLAYCKVRATLALIVKRSTTGTDYALSEAGLAYLEATLAKGTLKDGAAVRSAFVVLAIVDLRSPRHLKVISYSSVHEARARRNGLPAYPGKFGPFWWLTADTLSAEDEAFSALTM